MTLSTTTAAEAAEKALLWAGLAEINYRNAETYHGKGRLLREERGRQGDADACVEAAKEWDRLGENAVSLANMWSNVAGALHLVQGDTSS
ncbi:hypothetical protein [Streptomyces similanensis]|uniref:Tetratricopeptide repeat protein n=1 Tax=Streptomyces similanensis TaxID=1274988 RepID=A0ABP9L7X3_9ACTN